MFSQSIPKVSVQKLFAVTLILKIISSLLGLWLKSPWILGLLVPITIMIFYMVIGHFAREDDVSPEKFADSCYYLGFIFTITSIIVCLFDLPNLGGGEGLRNIALRFGAAMVSTVLGMGVRVYLVSFKKDTSDAIKDVEEAVLDATRMLVVQLDSIMEELKKFEIQIVDASKVSVENVNRQISNMGNNYAESLNGLFAKLTEKNEITFKEMLDEVRQATSKLATSVEAYSIGMKDNIEGIGRKAMEFADAVTSRLATTTFPDDFFAQQLKTPLEQLKFEASNLGENVRGVSSLIQESSETLGAVFKQVKAKTKKTQDAMDAVVQLSEQHRTLMNNADLQLNTLANLAERMEQIDVALKNSLQVISANSSASTELLTKVGFLANENSNLRHDIKKEMEAVTTKLDVSSTLAMDVMQELGSQSNELRTKTSEIIASLEHHSGTSSKLAQQLAASDMASKDIFEQLQAISGSRAEIGNTLKQTVQQANQAAHSVSQSSETTAKTFTQTIEVLGQVKNLDSSLRAHTEGMLEAVQKLHRLQENQLLLTTDAITSAEMIRQEVSPVPPVNE